MTNTATETYKMSFRKKMRNVFSRVLNRQKNNATDQDVSRPKKKMFRSWRSKQVPTAVVDHSTIPSHNDESNNNNSHPTTSVPVLSTNGTIERSRSSTNTKAVLVNRAANSSCPNNTNPASELPSHPPNDKSTNITSKVGKQPAQDITKTRAGTATKTKTIAPCKIFEEPSNIPSNSTLAAQVTTVAPLPEAPYVRLPSSPSNISPATFLTSSAASTSTSPAASTASFPPSSPPATHRALPTKSHTTSNPPSNKTCYSVQPTEIPRTCPSETPSPIFWTPPLITASTFIPAAPSTSHPHCHPSIASEIPQEHVLANRPEVSTEVASASSPAPVSKIHPGAPQATPQSDPDTSPAPAEYHVGSESSAKNSKCKSRNMAPVRRFRRYIWHWRRRRDNSKKNRGLVMIMTDGSARQELSIKSRWM